MTLGVVSFVMLLLNLARAADSHDAACDQTTNEFDDLLDLSVSFLQLSHKIEQIPTLATKETSATVKWLSEAEETCLTEILPQLSAANEDCRNQCGSEVDTFVINGSAQMSKYVELVRSPSVSSICETGFYLGQSAALWLCVNTNATLYSFDLEFPAESLQAIQTRFGERFVHFEGDSTVTLAEFAARPQSSCNVMIMDGGHFDPVPEADMMSFAAIAAKSPEIEYRLLVDEMYFNATLTQCCPDVTRLIVNKTCAGAFDSSSSRCFSRDIDFFAEQSYTSEAFDLTCTGVKAMQDHVDPYQGGFCELVFAPEFLAARF